MHELVTSLLTTKNSSCSPSRKKGGQERKKREMLKGEKGAFAWEWSDKGRFTCYTYRPFRTRTVLIGARIEKIAERIVIEVFACVCPSDIVGDNIFAERTIVLKST